LSQFIRTASDLLHSTQITVSQIESTLFVLKIYIIGESTIQLIINHHTGRLYQPPKDYCLARICFTESRFPNLTSKCARFLKGAFVKKIIAW